MEFRTPIQPLNHRGLITHNRPVIMLGSCFSDNIGNRLRNALFDIDINPFGTLYNPASIASALNDIINHRQYTLDDLFEHDGSFHSFSHHSRFSGIDSKAVLSDINSHISSARTALQNASVLCITFGTAYVFRLSDSNKVVSNCHKLPQSMFHRQAMPVDEIVNLWQPLIDCLHRFNPNLKIIFTVSPIRHLADGAHGNQLSKSTLLLAIDRLTTANPDMAIYFHTYEIMMDDLRDYRFYADDMTHPSAVAVDYIYKNFAQSFFNTETDTLARDCEKISRRLYHRPMTDDQEAINRFNSSTKQILESLLIAHPYLQNAVDNILRDK